MGKRIVRGISSKPARRPFRFFDRTPNGIHTPSKTDDQKKDDQMISVGNLIVAVSAVAFFGVKVLMSI